MYELYNGPSLIDEQPIVVLANGINEPSRNKKTGWMVQTWILRSDISPVDARKQGADRSVCGDCIHRSGSCYVTLHQAPQSIWQAWRRGRYPPNPKPDVRGRKVRLGAYGDPGAVPLEVWETLLKGADSWTGYTHQWQQRPDLKTLCMASVDTETEYQEATRRGWRTYRVVTSLDDLDRLETVCPTETTNLRCELCMACNGATGRRGNIAIPVHGASWKQQRFRDVRAA